MPPIAWRKILWLLQLLIWLPAAAATERLRFCFQDVALAPYYLGDGQQIRAVRPGATIEHLQNVVAAVPDVTLQLVRYPWQRCLRYLQTGEVDAVVANYSAERHALGVFPMKDEQPDPKRKFTQQDICLVTSKALAKKWNGQSFTGLSKVTLAHQSSRSLHQSLTHRQFVRVPISAQAKALDMLAQNKVQAVSMVCKIAGKSVMPSGFDPQTMQTLEPSVEVLHGYLVFSKPFYSANQRLAEELWSQLREPQTAIYLEYLNAPDLD